MQVQTARADPVVLWLTRAALYPGAMGVSVEHALLHTKGRPRGGDHSVFPLACPGRAAARVWLAWWRFVGTTALASLRLPPPRSE